MAQAKRNGVRRIIECLLIVIIVACVIAISAIGLQYFLQAQKYADLSDRVVLEGDGGDLARMSIDWDELRKECPDIVGWIIVPDTVINYPVVQGPDNEFYLHRSYDGTTSWLSTGGTIFLDAENHADFSDMNNALYGHHMNDGSMFAEMAKWTRQDEFNANRTVYILTPQVNYRLETFSVVLTVGTEEIVQTTFGTLEEFAEYVQDKIDRSVVDASGVVINPATTSKTFMLVTCEYSNYDGRECVYARVAEQAVPLSTK